MPDDVPCRGGIIDSGRERPRRDVNQLMEKEPDVLDIGALILCCDSIIDIFGQLRPLLGPNIPPGSAADTATKGTPSIRELPGFRSSLPRHRNLPRLQERAVIQLGTLILNPPDQPREAGRAEGAGGDTASSPAAIASAICLIAASVFGMPSSACRVRSVI